VFLQFLAGSALVTLGLLLLFVGVDLGLLPMGRFIGAALSQYKSLSLMLAVVFAMGFATTTAEPDVLVLAGHAEAVAQGTLSAQRLVYIIAAGVGLFVAVAMLRVVWGFSMAWQLTAVYSLVIVLSLLAPSALAPLAYDAGSVTTGVLSGPVVLALALGVSSVLAGRTAVADGFGGVCVHRRGCGWSGNRSIGEYLFVGACARRLVGRGRSGSSRARARESPKWAEMVTARNCWWAPISGTRRI
jgi:hypothetical protein